YPAVTWSDVGTAPVFRAWASYSRAPLQLARSLFYLAGFAVSAAASLWLLLKLKGHVFETSLAPTTRAAEKRVRLQQGPRVAVLEKIQLRSARLPKRAHFRCVGRHLVVVRACAVVSFVLALADIAVPTGLCLAVQALGIAALVIYARFHWATNAPGVARVSCDCAGG